MRKANVIVTAVLVFIAAVGWGLVLIRVWPYQRVGRTVEVFLVTVTVCACLGWVVLVLTHARDTETRCRRCGYILRGLAEPRCPECGKSI